MASITNTNYGQASNAAFLGDFGNREHVLPGGAKLDSAVNFTAEGDVAVHNTAVAVVGATSITVSALPGAIPAGAQLNFTGGKYAIVATAAAASATSITVEPLGEEIADESDAIYDASGDSVEVVTAGTIVGRTIAERASGADFGPVADADDDIYIVAHDVDLSKTNDVDLIRYGTLIKQNFLPSYTGASATVKTKLEARYQLVLG